MNLPDEIEEAEEGAGLEDEGEREFVGEESRVQHLEEEVEGAVGEGGGGVGADEMVVFQEGASAVRDGVEEGGAGGGDCATMGGEAGIGCEAEAEGAGLDLAEGERIGMAVEGSGQ